MPELILTPEQVRVLATAYAPVPVKDPGGTVVGHIDPVLTPEKVAELKRRAASPGPWYTGAQVQARLQDLEAEWERTGGFDAAHAQSLLKRLNEQDPGHVRGERPQ